MAATVVPRGGYTRGLAIWEVEGVSGLPLLGRTTWYVVTHAHTQPHSQPHTNTHVSMSGGLGVLLLVTCVFDGDGVCVFVFLIGVWVVLVLVVGVWVMLMLVSEWFWWR